MIIYNRQYALYKTGLYETGHREQALCPAVKSFLRKLITTMCFAYNEKYDPNQWNFKERFRHHMWRIKSIYG